MLLKYYSDVPGVLGCASIDTNRSPSKIWWFGSYSKLINRCVGTVRLIEKLCELNTRMNFVTSHNYFIFDCLLRSPINSPASISPYLVVSCLCEVWGCRVLVVSFVVMKLDLHLLRVKLLLVIDQGSWCPRWLWVVSVLSYLYFWWCPWLIYRSGVLGGYI